MRLIHDEMMQRTARLALPACHHQYAANTAINRLVPVSIIRPLALTNTARSTSCRQQLAARRPFVSIGADHHPSKDWIINPHLRDHIRQSMSASILDDPHDQARDTGWSVIFLGTGAGKTTPRRSNTATALRRGANAYLFDAGEGVQKQIMLSRMSETMIRKIFITHLHGDHIFGLPGLLLSLQIAAKVAERPSRQIIQVYGPVGIHNFIASTLSFSAAELTWLTVQVFELQGGSRRWQHPGASRTYGEFRHRGLERRVIPQNKDGTWTISTAAEIESQEDALKLPNSEPNGEYIYAAEVQHVPKVQCFGYVIREPFTQPWRIDKEKATAVGIKPGKKYRLLKSGFPVMSDDGSREVQPSEVLVGDRSPSRSIALLGDCYNVPAPMLKLCEEVDLLVHEATFLEGDKGNKVDFGGHSTAAQAARVADAVKAKYLFLNHIASGASCRSAEEDIVKEAVNAVKGRTKVQLSYDHLELQIPRSGLC